MVGTLTAGVSTLNPRAGAGGTSGGSQQLDLWRLHLGLRRFGGGAEAPSVEARRGSSSLHCANVLSFHFSGREPARAVAKTARKTIKECNIMLKMVPPADRPFL